MTQNPTAKTATLIAENIGGYVGVANVYRLSEPLEGAKIVTVFVQDWFGKQPPEAVIVRAVNEYGAAYTMNRLSGSYVSPDANHAKALSLAGYSMA